MAGSGPRIEKPKFCFFGGAGGGNNAVLDIYIPARPDAPTCGFDRNRRLEVARLRACERTGKTPAPSFANRARWRWGQPGAISKTA